MDGGDGRGGKCMEGRKGKENDINRILLKYRPIAPKPVVGGSGGAGSSGSSVLNGKRTKRKYVRVSSKNKEVKEEKRIVTLQLLPERADPEAEISQLRVSSSNSNSNDLDFRVLEQDDNNKNDNNDDNVKNIWYSGEVGGGGSGVRSRVIESWVTVESVAMDKRIPEACGWYREESWLLVNDNFVQQQLDGDSCPGFISRAESGRVEWVNEAYKRMVGCGSDDRMVVVWLEIKDEVVKVISRLSTVKTVFSCWVKVQYNNEEDGTGRRGVSMVLPCDAWRVERGGFAWRLDARAALCLGIITDSDGCICPN